MLSHDECYRVIQAKDARFDGLFFTAVKTTKIYCRPICHVKPPKSENCTFFETAAQAESNGYRPCLRCRPELAPGYADVEQKDELVKLAIGLFDEYGYEPKSIHNASEALGITPRHLNRVFKNTLGVSPQSYLMTRRLLLSKALLTDTLMPVGEIATRVGFGSLSRFNAAFKKQYQLIPTALRKKSQNKCSKDGWLTIKLCYRPPYDWSRMMAFYRMRAIPGVEWVTDEGIYRRSYLQASYSGWIEIKPIEQEHCIQLLVSHSLEKVLIQVITTVRKAFDLDLVSHALPADLPKGIRLPGSYNAFEMGVRAILGQQITVKAARTLAKRFVDLLGMPVSTPWKEIYAHFPTSQRLLSLDTPISEVLGPIGIIKNRSLTIEALARAIENGTLGFGRGVQYENVIQTLLSVKGIGPWTASYLSMRGLSWPDAFPVSDIGVKNALLPVLYSKEELAHFDRKKQHADYEKRALLYSNAYKPWRSYLTIALWTQMEEGS